MWKAFFNNKTSDESTKVQFFAQDCYETIAKTTDYPRYQVIRDYKYVSCDTNAKMVKHELRKMISKNKNMKGFVSVWIGETLKKKIVVHWCIDVPMCRPRRFDFSWCF
jgi:hypothetical protein